MKLSVKNQQIELKEGEIDLNKKKLLWEEMTRNQEVTIASKVKLKRTRYTNEFR